MTLFPNGVTGSETMTLLIKMISFITKTQPCVGKGQSINSLIHSDGGNGIGDVRVSSKNTQQRVWASVLVDQGTKGLLKVERVCCLFPPYLLVALDAEGTAGCETIAQ